MNDGMIVEAIRSVRMSQADQAQALGNVQPAVNPEAVERFQAAMAADGVGAPARVDAVPFADELSAVWRNAQADHQEMLHRIKALSEMGQHGTSAVAMLELQYEVSNLAFQQEVVSKVADKSSNAVQTLIKNQ
ncbi:MAG: hypothetical protein II943_02735 [Victivallales bacterium]|nr:hypothetical protein [Victivallales bacterium]